MAKSLRSKIKRKFRATRRVEIHGPEEEKRLSNITARLAKKPLPFPEEKRFSFKNKLVYKHNNLKPVSDDPEGNDTENVIVENDKDMGDGMDVEDSTITTTDVGQNEKKKQKNKFTGTFKLVPNQSKKKGCNAMKKKKVFIWT